MKKAVHRIFAVLLACLLLCGILPLAASAATDITDDFTDPIFRAAVYRLLYKTAPEPIYDTDVAGLERLNVPGRDIVSLAGLEHFVSLERLNCNYNLLTSLPALPAGLRDLSCADNRLTALPDLPAALEYLSCEDNELVSLPDLPANLSYLACDNNRLTSLSALPAIMQGLYCRDNELTSLPNLPAALKMLYCENNKLASLPSLPPNLTTLVCANNRLTGFDVTGPPLLYLDCRNNSITAERNVTGFNGMWVELEDLWRPLPAYYYYPQNVTQQNTSCVRGHHIIWCIAESRYGFTDGVDTYYGPVQYQICKNRCGKVINRKDYTSGVGVLYRNNMSLPPPAADMAGQNFRYVVTRGGQYIEVVEHGGQWEIRSKKHFLKNTTGHEISVVSDLGSFVVVEVHVYLRWFTWDWFKTYFLFGWIWF